MEKNNNILSVIILLPMLCFLSLLGLGYLGSVIDSFPHHLLSCIFCFSTIIILIFNIIKNNKLRIISFLGTILFIIVLVLVRDGINNPTYETYRSLEEYDFVGKIDVTFFSGTSKGNVELIKLEDHYNIKLVGKNKGNYTFEITDEENNVYRFKYYYDKKEKTVVLERGE